MKQREQEIAEIKARIFPGSQSHWYDGKGTPCHEIENKSKPGEYRPVTKADAKKLSLVPSVTNILGRCESKPGLDAWKRNQIYSSIKDPEVLRGLLAAAEAGNDAAYNLICQQADEAANAIAGKAADIGSAFHHAADLMLDPVTIEELMELTGMERAQTSSCMAMFENSIVPDLMRRAELMSERSLVWNEFAGQEFGVGGRVDLVAVLPAAEARDLRHLHEIMSPNHEARDFVNDRISRNLPVHILIDWKTRKPTRGSKHPEIPSFPSYPSDVAQLAAYGSGIKRSLLTPIHLAMNILVPSDYLVEEGVPFSRPVHRCYSPAQIESGLKLFHSAIQHWIAEEEISGSNYQPLINEEP
jgi:hypothetical protein